MPSASSSEQTGALVQLLPVMGVIFVAYLIIGLAMPVLPLHVHDDLGYGAFAVGLVTGSQFAAALFTRAWAGHFTDRKGARRAMTLGLSLSAVTGLFYLGSLAMPEAGLAIVMLMAGRIFLGAGESFIITGALSWGLVCLGPQNTGKVMSFVGTAMFAAYAIGAPLGAALAHAYGFIAIGIATGLIPFVALALSMRMQHFAAHAPNAPAALRSVLAAIWVPGLTVALSGVGFASITTFIALLFAERHWPGAWAAFTALSVAFIAGRMLFGHLPDRIGGAKVALVCVLIETVGQTLIWLAPNVTMALIGVAISGAGFSLVFPAMGVEAIRRAPPQNRALAMGAYTTCLDFSFTLSGPVLGLVAGVNIAAAFGASAAIVAISAVIAGGLVISAAKGIKA